MGFQSHSFYPALGSHFKRLLEACDVSELDRERAETNPSNQPNQPAIVCESLPEAIATTPWDVGSFRRLVD